MGKKKTNQYFHYSICIVIILLLIIYCDNSNNDKNNYIENTNNKNSTLNLKLTKIEDVVLKEDAESVIGNCLGLCVDENNRIYYCDESDCQIIVFDQSGNQLRRISRQGRGPGEVTRIRDFDVRKGLVCISHTIGREITVFDTTGTLLNSFVVESVMGGRTKLNNDQEIYIGVNKYDKTYDGNYNDKNMKRKTKLIAKYKVSGKAFQYFANYDEEIIKRGIWNPTLGGAPIFFIDLNNNTYLTYVKFMKVQKYNSEGVLLETLDLRSPLFNPLYKYLEIDTENSNKIFNNYRGETSSINKIHFLQNLNALVVLHLNQHLKPPIMKWHYNNVKYYLNIYHYPTKLLIPDYDITDIVGPREAKITFGPDEVLYVLTNDEYKDITLSKYRIDFN